MGEGYIDDVIIAPVSKTHLPFCQKVAKEAGQDFDIQSFMIPDTFSGMEYMPTIPFLREAQKAGKTFDPTRVLEGKKVFLIKTSGPYQDPEKMVARVGFTASAFKQYGAERVTVIATDLDNGRAERGPAEDRKVSGYMNKVMPMAQMWKSCGVDKVISLHPHSPEIEKIFEKVFGCPNAFVGINPVYMYADYLAKHSGLRSSGALENGGENLIFLSFDRGIRTFMDNLADVMDMPNARRVRFNKARGVPNRPDMVEIDLCEDYPEGVLEGKCVVSWDDILDTGSGLGKIYRWIEENYSGHKLGKPAGYYFGFTHPVLSGQAFPQVQMRICNEMPKMREIIFTNSRPYIDDHLDFYGLKAVATILRVAKLFAHVIKAELGTASEIEEAHRILFENNMLQGNVYDVKRSSSYASKVGSGLPPGFVESLKLKENN